MLALQSGHPPGLPIKGQPCDAELSERGLPVVSTRETGLTTGAGVRSGFRRHSCARHWVQRGPNVDAVSAWLGHSSPTVTLDTYLVLALDTLGDIGEVT